MLIFKYKNQYKDKARKSLSGILKLRIVFNILSYLETQKYSQKYMKQTGFIILIKITLSKWKTQNRNIKAEKKCKS